MDKETWPPWHCCHVWPARQVEGACLAPVRLKLFWEEAGVLEKKKKIPQPLPGEPGPLEVGLVGQRVCSLGVAVTAPGEPSSLGQVSIPLGEGSSNEVRGASSSSPTLHSHPLPTPSPEESLAAGAWTSWRGRGRSHSIVWEGGEKLRP